jgi:hypothetical protein
MVIILSLVVLLFNLDQMCSLSLCQQLRTKDSLQNCQIIQIHLFLSTKAERWARPETLTMFVQACAVLSCTRVKVIRGRRMRERLTMFFSHARLAVSITFCKRVCVKFLNAACQCAPMSAKSPNKHDPTTTLSTRHKALSQASLRPGWHVRQPSFEPRSTRTHL